MRITSGGLQFESFSERGLGFIQLVGMDEVLSESPVKHGLQGLQPNNLLPQRSGFIPPALNRAEAGQIAEHPCVLLAHDRELSFGRREIPIGPHINIGELSMRAGEVGLERESTAKGGPRFFKVFPVSVKEGECTQGSRFQDIGIGIIRIECDCLVEQRNGASVCIRV